MNSVLRLKTKTKINNYYMNTLLQQKSLHIFGGFADSNKTSMIQQQTKLKVSDNSGAKVVKCIKTLGGFKKKYNKINETIVVSIKKLRNKSKLSSKVRKGEIYKAIIIKTKKKLQKKDGSTFKNNENSIILLNKQNKPVATRIISPITKELKLKKFAKLKNIGTGII